MLTEIFGNCPKVKVIDLLISHPGSEYSKTDIANLSGVSRSTLYEFLDQLKEYGIIKPTKKVGNTQLFEVNMSSEITQLISAFQLSLADIEIQKQIKLSENGVKAGYDDISQEEVDNIFDFSEPEHFKSSFKLSKKGFIMTPKVVKELRDWLNKKIDEYEKTFNKKI